MKSANNISSIKSRSHHLSRNLWSGVLFGLGFVLFIDETIFHQLLHWHHFYDKSTTTAGLISDGFLHALSWFATIGGLFIFADLRRRNQFKAMKWWGGVLAGAGAFQLYDGTIQHKLMGIHQIRYVDNVLIYDIIWNIVAILLLVAGILLILRSKNKEEARKDVPSD